MGCFFCQDMVSFLHQSLQNFVTKSESWWNPLDFLKEQRKSSTTASTIRYLSEQDIFVCILWIQLKVCLFYQKNIRSLPSGYKRCKATTSLFTALKNLYIIPKLKVVQLEWSERRKLFRFLFFFFKHNPRKVPYGIAAYTSFSTLSLILHSVRYNNIVLKAPLEGNLCKTYCLWARIFGV